MWLETEFSTSFRCLRLIEWKARNSSNKKLRKKNAENAQNWIVCVRLMEALETRTERMLSQISIIINCSNCLLHEQSRDNICKSTIIRRHFLGRKPFDINYERFQWKSFVAHETHWLYWPTIFHSQTFQMREWKFNSIFIIFYWN